MRNIQFVILRRIGCVLIILNKSLSIELSAWPPQEAVLHERMRGGGVRGPLQYVGLGHRGLKP